MHLSIYEFIIIKIMKKESQVDSNGQISFFQQFKQQILKAWLPVPTLSKAITLFFIMSAIFIGIGIPMIIMSNQIVEVRSRYDNLCTIGGSCILTFQIPQTMQAPVFFYYQLNNYYQNHRLYANSVSSSQLAGDTISLSDASKYCSPIVKNSDIYKTVSIDNTTLDPNEPANPCGIIAYSIFNDSFVITKSSGSTVTISTDDIVWASDLKKYKISNPSKQWYNVTDPRFMNWMRIASLPDFRKLWGKINEDLSAGQYTITISNYYDISKFGANKFFVLSTSNFFGSKNLFLSILYLVMGFLCLIVGILFTIRKFNKKKKENK